MLRTKQFCKATVATMIAAAILLTGCAGGSLSTREKGAGIGALGGAAAGGIIGSSGPSPGSRARSSAARSGLAPAR